LLIIIIIIIIMLLAILGSRPDHKYTLQTDK